MAKPFCDCEETPRKESHRVNSLLSHWSSWFQSKEKNIAESGFRDKCDALFKEHQGLVLSYFQKRGLNRDDCHDLAQIVFINAYKGMHQFRGETLFKNWLLKIARNVWFDQSRGKSGQRMRHEIRIDEPNEHPLMEPESQEKDPLEFILEQERKERLSKALDQLPDRMRQCLLYRVHHGMSCKEIANVMGVQPETVKAHIYQSKRKLFKLLKELSTSREGARHG